ncbi:4-diphosphocytidyl-2C-methyl-D-erythritol synthase [Thermosipho africanus Ob7]|uniref:IspD/TarI family cytidylyltransferase n=1 Tax=Thermosipho africanus TaxID=2421 RepID=UPI000E0C6FCF|nr:IspD/TarI family cytidylyltransferase [Thermosipho africanus]RDI92765.1 4-diphosphocytidyl-2C-methyl-D-erythritol synthase [Thermosipho africanus Ob7]
MIVGVILFGGKGTRFSKDFPKQFLKFNGKTLMEHTVEKFLLDCFEFLVVVSNKDYINKSIEILKKFEKKIYVIEGGKTREHSTFNAIKFLENKIDLDDIVLIHDGARPFVNKDIIEKNIENAKLFGATVTAISSENTIAVVENDFILSVPKRENIFIIQTPQTFKYKVLKDSFLKFSNRLDNFTDDGSVVLASGYKVSITEGNKKNIKITTVEDLHLMGVDEIVGG